MRLSRLSRQAIAWRIQQFGVKVEGLNTTEQAEGVFSTVILPSIQPGKEGVNKLKKLLKLKRRSGAPGGLGKVGSKVPFIQEGSYLENSMVDTFKDKIF